jgi:hypothetical protein
MKDSSKPQTPFWIGRTETQLRHDYSDIGLLKAYKMNLAGPREVRADTEGDASTHRNNATTGPLRLETRGLPGLEGSM